jgi:futalosine hydrolase
VLIAVAAAREAEAVFRGLGVETPAGSEEWALVRAAAGFDVVRSGVGKANAAGAVARVLDPGRHAAVLSVGVAGSLPGSPADLGDVVVGTAAVFADEGVATPDGFVDCATLGFAPGPFGDSSVPLDADLVAWLRPLGRRAGVIATVSTCSGRDDLARAVAARTGAIAEAMEGAAVASVAWRVGVPAGEIRVISNTTGRRESQRWDLEGALGVLAGVIGRL